jgi:hypothetical protein
MLSLNDFLMLNMCDVTSVREVLVIMILLRNYGTVVYVIFQGEEWSALP